MAVEVLRPADWRNADMVEVQSTAPDNAQAIVEIEAWAAENGMWRTRESWLQAVLLANGLRAFRAICFRPSEEDVRGVEQRIQARHNALEATQPH